MKRDDKPGSSISMRLYLRRTLILLGSDGAFTEAKTKAWQKATALTVQSAAIVNKAGYEFRNTAYKFLQNDKPVAHCPHIFQK